MHKIAKHHKQHNKIYRIDEQPPIDIHCSQPKETKTSVQKPTK